MCARASFLFHGRVIFHGMDGAHPACLLLVAGHLGHAYVATRPNNVALSIRVHIFVWTYIFISRDGTAGLESLWR